MAEEGKPRSSVSMSVAAQRPLMAANRNTLGQRAIRVEHLSLKLAGRWEDKAVKLEEKGP